MINVNEFKPGVTFLYEKDPYIVIESAHSKSGRGQAHVKAKVKNLKTGTIKSITFTGGDVVAPAIIERKKVQYLYKEDNLYIFMDEETYDQVNLNEDVINWEKNFLVEGESIDLKMHKDNIIGIELKSLITLEVIYTEPAVKGNTATGATKQATLSTGFHTQVPLFINNHDKIIINTTDGTYKSRA